MALDFKIQRLEAKLASAKRQKAGHYDTDEFVDAAFTETGERLDRLKDRKSGNWICCLYPPAGHNYRVSSTEWAILGKTFEMTQPWTLSQYFATRTVSFDQRITFYADSLEEVRPINGPLLRLFGVVIYCWPADIAFIPVEDSLLYYADRSLPLHANIFYNRRVDLSDFGIVHECYVGVLKCAAQRSINAYNCRNFVRDSIPDIAADRAYNAGFLEHCSKALSRRAGRIREAVKSICANVYPFSDLAPAEVEEIFSLDSSL